MKLTLNHPFPLIRETRRRAGRGKEEAREMVDRTQSRDRNIFARYLSRKRPVMASTFFPCPPGGRRSSGSICLSFETAKSSEESAAPVCPGGIMDVYPSRDNVRRRTRVDRKRRRSSLPLSGKTVFSVKKESKAVRRGVERREGLAFRGIVHLGRMGESRVIISRRTVTDCAKTIKERDSVPGILSPYVCSYV